MNQPLILPKGWMLCIMVLFANTQYAPTDYLNPKAVATLTMKTF